MLAGFANASANNWQFGVARLLTDGSLDATFGIGGRVLTDLPSDNEGVMDVVVQPDGKILAVGRATFGTITNHALVRYNTDGTLDAGTDDHR